jgi:hypothetical protein
LSHIDNVSDIARVQSRVGGNKQSVKKKQDITATVGTKYSCRVVVECVLSTVAVGLTGQASDRHISDANAAMLEHRWSGRVDNIRITCVGNVRRKLQIAYKWINFRLLHKSRQCIAAKTNWIPTVDVRGSVPRRYIESMFLNQTSSIAGLH